MGPGFRAVALVTICSLAASCVSGKLTVLPKDVQVTVDGKPLVGATTRLSGPSTLFQTRTRQLDFFADGRKIGTRIYALEFNGAALILGLFTLLVSTVFWAYRFPDREYDLRAMAGAVRLKLPLGILLGKKSDRLSLSAGIFGEIRYFEAEPAKEIVVRATALTEKGTSVFFPGRSPVASCRLPGPIRSGDAPSGGCNKLWLGAVHCIRVDEIRITFESGREQTLSRADFADLPIDDCRIKLGK